MIYFIACPEANAVKIGVTNNCIHKRIGSMQCDCPFRLEILGVQDGSFAEERELQAGWSDLRIQGEWYRLTDEIRAHIQEHCSDAPPPPVKMRRGRLPCRWPEEVAA